MGIFDALRFTRGQTTVPNEAPAQPRPVKAVFADVKRQLAEQSASSQPLTLETKLLESDFPILSSEAGETRLKTLAREHGFQLTGYEFVEKKDPKGKPSEWFLSARFERPPDACNIGFGDRSSFEND